MCDFSDKDIKFSKCSCVLNCFVEYPGVFVSDVEMICEEYFDLPFIHFHHYANISSCYLQIYIFLVHGKACPSCTNIENIEKGKFTTRKIFVLKSCSILGFHSEYYTPAIEKLSFFPPHVFIIGVNNCEGKL